MSADLRLMASIIWPMRSVPELAALIGPRSHDVVPSSICRADDEVMADRSVTSLDWMPVSASYE